MESGTGGSEIVEAEPGDFVLVPRRTVHRESNPSDEESRLIVVRSGSGEVVVNTDGPDPA
jgi:mannose-6-phosphate isomerase-like protein (cupin superfamily)